MSSSRSFFFALYKKATQAGVATDIFILKFLHNIPGGKKIYNSQKGLIKADMSDAEITQFYKEILPKMEKQVNPEPTRHEEYIFPVTEEEKIPSWAADMKKDIEGIRSQMDDIVDDESSEDEQVWWGGTRNERRPSKQSSCRICHRNGHTASKCFKRTCFKCEGKGDYASDCPSVRQTKESTAKNKQQKTKYPDKGKGKQ